jgi:hypothetical protein
MGVVRAVLFFQDGEMTLAGSGFIWLSQFIVNAAHYRQIRQRFGTIGTLMGLVNFDGASMRGSA